MPGHRPRRRRSSARHSPQPHWPRRPSHGQQGLRFAEEIYDPGMRATTFREIVREHPSLRCITRRSPPSLTTVACRDDTNVANSFRHVAVPRERPWPLLVCGEMCALACSLRNIRGAGALLGSWRPSVFPPDGQAPRPSPPWDLYAPIRAPRSPVEALFFCAPHTNYSTFSSFCSERSGRFIGVSGKLVVQLV